MFSKFVYATSAILCAFLLSACDLVVKMDVRPDGTATLTHEVGATKVVVADGVGIAHVGPDDVFDLIDRNLEDRDDPKTGHTDRFTLTQSGDDMRLVTKSTVRYDRYGITGPNAGSSAFQIQKNADGETVRVSFDMTTYSTAAGFDQAGIDRMIEGLDKASLKMKLPGDVLEASGGGVIDGYTVTWGMDELQAAHESGEPLVVIAKSSGAPQPVNYAPFITGLVIVMLLGAFGFFSYNGVQKAKAREQKSAEGRDGGEPQP